MHPMCQASLTSLPSLAVPIPTIPVLRVSCSRSHGPGWNSLLRNYFRVRNNPIWEIFLWEKYVFLWNTPAFWEVSPFGECFFQTAASHSHLCLSNAHWWVGLNLTSAASRFCLKTAFSGWANCCTLGSHGKKAQTTISAQKITKKKHVFCNILQFTPKQRKLKVVMHLFIYLLRPIHSGSH